MQISDYVQRLEQLGCELLGKGLYAHVFAIPNTDKVIKVAERDKWPDYIKWATENGYAGKFAPKVTSLKFYDDFYVAVMERLVCTINQAIYPGEGAHTRTFQTELYNNCNWKPGDCPLCSEATDFMAFIAKLRDANLTGDLHGGNAMLRSDGQLVVTDPCSGNGETEFRMKAGVCL